jgi:hypothetical protein
MKTTDFIKEGYIADDADAMHKDHEVQMARQDCYNSAKNAIELHALLKNISEMQGLEGWVSEKISLASDYLKTVKEYLEYEQLSKNSDGIVFNAESAEKTFEAVLNGTKMGGPTNAAEYKRMLGDVYDLMSQDKDPSNRDIYNQKIADLKRVAKERGIPVAEDASIGGTSSSSIATSMGGGNGFANGGPGTLSRAGKSSKSKSKMPKVTISKGIY